jgi:hypothetical protein
VRTVLAAARPLPSPFRSNGCDGPKYFSNGRRKQVHGAAIGFETCAAPAGVEI